MYTWEELEEKCLNCQKCKLAETRTNVVIGVGNKNSDILFIGEGPGEQEDLKGEPFVGAAGKLLDKMLSAINLDRNEIYIANIVKCRPPFNRDPEKSEQAACINFLRHQFLLIRPKIIVCLGRKSRGIWYNRKNCDIIATYHPSALLRDENKKRPAWEDFKAIRKKYDEVRSANE